MSTLQHDVDLMTAEDMEKAANRGQIPAGKYRGQVTERKGITTSDVEFFERSGQANPYYGKESDWLTVTLYDVPTEEGGTRPAKQGFAISAARVVTPQGFGIPSRNYAMLAKALGTGPAPLDDVAAKAVDGPFLQFTVGKKGYIDRIEAEA